MEDTKARQKSDEFWTIIRPEIPNALKDEHVPVNKVTIQAASVGITLAMRVYAEQLEQFLMDEGADPETFLNGLRFGGKPKKGA
jgi:hypothetical protein